MGDQVVVPRVKIVRQVPRGLETHPFLLDELHVRLARNEADEAGERGGDREGFGLEHAYRGFGGIEGVEDNAARAAFWEGLLFIIDEPTLHGERNEHAQNRKHHHEPEDLPPWERLVFNPHVCRDAGDERAGHIARRSRDGLHRVVLEDGEIASTQLREHAEGCECEDDACEADAERPAGLGADVKVGCGEHAAEQKAGEGGAQRQLGHVAAEDVGEPPTVFLFAGPGADLFGREGGNGHRGHTIPETRDEFTLLLRRSSVRAMVGCQFFKHQEPSGDREFKIWANTRWFEQLARACFP